MPVPDATRCRLAALTAAAAALLALAACEQGPSSGATEALNQPPKEPAIEAPVPTSPVPVPSADDAMAGASYEVAIATGAANRKRALADCDDRPASDRKACIAQVEADWEVAKSTVDDLRGEQE